MFSPLSEDWLVGLLAGLHKTTGWISVKLCGRMGCDYILVWGSG